MDITKIYGIFIGRSIRSGSTMGMYWEPGHWETEPDRPPKPNVWIPGAWVILEWGCTVNWKTDLDGIKD